MPNRYLDFAERAANQTDNQFKTEMSSLTRFNDEEVESLINDSGISRVDLAKVLKEVKDAAKENHIKAEAIVGISKGVDVLVSIAKKLI